MLDRRVFTLGGTAAVLAGASSAAQAQIYCSNSRNSSARVCNVGLENVPLVHQQCRNWCWAACAELAFKVQGFHVIQNAFVRKVYNDPHACRTANGPMIQRAISGAWIDANGTAFRAHAQPLMDLDSVPRVYNQAPLQAVRTELEAGRLVIAGTLGHAICISAMTYWQDIRGKTGLQSITVRDPWPPSGSRYAMTPQQFHAGRLLMSVWFSTDL